MFRAHSFPSVIERDTPVKADDFGSSFAHRGQQRGAVGAKVNDGYSGFLQRLYQFRGARKHVTAVVFDAQASDPAVKNLNGVRARSDLLGGVFGSDRNELAQQLVPDVRG